MTTEHRYPALGSAVWWVLLRNEWFKARHRLAFVVALAMYAFITIMEHASSVMSARERDDVEYALPDAWSQIFSGDSILLLIFGSIVVIMLTSSEFTWRTARQNVIDGLGKMQWFTGKVFLLFLVGVVFLAVKVGIGVVAALLGTDFSAGLGLFPGSAFAAAGALLIAFLSTGGLALLISLSARSSGPAMALWFFWITMAEQLIPAIVMRFAPSTEPLFAYLPFAAAQRVLPFPVFDAGVQARIIGQAEAAGNVPPDFPDPWLWIGVNAGWALLFLGLAWILFQRRDL